MLNLLAAVAALASLGMPQGARTEPLQVGFTNTTQKHPPVVAPLQAAQAQAATAPGSLMRFAIQWRLAQPNEGGPLDLETYDRELVQPALSQGLRPVIVLIAAPEWAWGDGDCDEAVTRNKGFCTMPPGDDPDSLAAWADFVRAVAERWGDDIAAIEVWNEQNGAGFWSEVDGPDPAQYADVLCTAAGAVRDVSPETPVVLGGLAGSFGSDDLHLSATDYLAALYEDGDLDVRECMDAIAIHPYPGQDPPNAAGSKFLTKLAEIRAVRDGAGDTERPIWITEFGYWTGGTGAVSPADQAAGLGCAVQLAAGMPDIEAFLIHDLVDRGPPGTIEGSFGVYAQAAGRVIPKPAAIALRLLLAGGEAGIPPAPPC